MKRWSHEWAAIDVLVLVAGVALYAGCRFFLDQAADPDSALEVERANHAGHAEHVVDLAELRGPRSRP